MAFSARPSGNIGRILSQPYPFDIVDGNKRRAVKKFGPDYLIDFGIGDPTDATPAIIRAKCKEAVDERSESGYPASVGHALFREAAAKWMRKRFGVSLESDNIIATYGAKYASFHIPLCFINPDSGEIGLVPNPGYPPYSDGTILAGATPFYLNILEENGFEPDFSGVDAGTAKKARVLFLNSPHSPTGRVYSVEKLREAVDFCLDNNILLVSDECYSELYFSEKPRSILEIRGAEECSIVLNSFSKRSMMTGYAVGFAASKSPELLAPLECLARKSTQGVATFIQDAAVAALRDEEHTTAMRAAYEKRVDAFLPALLDIGCNAKKPDGTFFMWVRVPNGFSALSFAERLLLEFGINCVPGDLVSREFNGVNPGKGFVRFAMVASLEKSLEAAERLSKWK
jgi:LL-diaminopimelate aminotransferase